jgi:Uma2 family endonuclease
MAAGLVHPLTLEEFDREYGDARPYYEYWDGEAIPKPMPTLFHSLLQFVLIRLFHQYGLIAAGEVRVKVRSDKQPLPDVIADERLQHPYPTRPFAIAVEILSPEDRMQHVLRKCRFYAASSVSFIYVLDPEERTMQRWIAGALVPVAELALPNRPSIPEAEVWGAFEQELTKVDR